MLIKDIFNHNNINNNINTKGWIRTSRIQKDMIFINLNDGSCLKCIQIVIPSNILSEYKLKSLSTGISIEVNGLLLLNPNNDKEVELNIDKDEDLIILGINHKMNPIAKSKLGLDFLRKIPHLRIRTNTFSAIARIRHQMAMGTHDFYGKIKNFILVAPPQITENDCEGGGETFQVTTLLKDNHKIDYTKDFFGKPVYLTVSGQLALETYCMALGGVYSYQNAFRADPSQTTRHVAEFTMLEVEMAFCNLDDNMNIAEEYIKFIINHILNNCLDDLEFLDKFYYKNKFNKSLIDNLKELISDNFIRIKYSDAMKLLLKIQKDGYKFETPLPETGIFDFKSEHEKYLTDVIFKKPVFITHYPSKIKAFYMKPAGIDEYLNTEVVECCDLLVPGIGEVLGGSSRNADYESLKKIMEEYNLLNDNTLDYYLDLRAYGTVEHSGFGIGMSRLLMMLSGMDNIRDMIEFPRTIGSIDY